MRYRATLRSIARLGQHIVRETERVGLPTYKWPRLSVPYSLRMLWRDRRRYLPALLAIGLSAVLIAVQCGLVIGLVRCRVPHLPFKRDAEFLTA